MTAKIKSKPNAGRQNAERQKAANKRSLVAIQHLCKAAAEVQDAMADLSRVIGASEQYRKLTKVHADIVEARIMLDQALHIEAWTLDHDPTAQELRCGHGPKHGCGRGAR